jgi:hypothetical protein
MNLAKPGPLLPRVVSYDSIGRRALSYGSPDRKGLQNCPIDHEFRAVGKLCVPQVVKYDKRNDMVRQRLYKTHC